jgi:hypothetical protein
MSDFEREVVQCLNRFFRNRHIPGFAYRLKPQKKQGLCADILVDSLNPAYNLSIECKSIIDKKLYFSQHFHADKKTMHPVDAISDFLAKTGRNGFLAIEFRHGPDIASEAFLIPWATVVKHFIKNQGITVDDARNHIEIGHGKNGYILDHM